MEREKQSKVTRRKFLLNTGLSLAGIAAASSSFGMSSILRNLPAGFQKKEFQKNELPPYIIENNLSDDPLLKLGFLNLKHYAKGDGVTDDTEGIRKALNDIYNYNFTLYASGGTYLVSDMLDCRVDLEMINGNLKPIKKYPIIGDPANRPVFKLTDNAPLFQDINDPRPVLKVWINHPKFPQAGAWLMNSGGVTSVIIDCGKNNPGAIGLKCHGAQAQFVENITVKAYGAYAGIKDVIGNAGYMANIEVVGGKYGIWAQYGQSGAIAGCTLIDQEVAAIRQELFWPLTITGFKIEKDAGPVVEINDSTGEVFNGHLCLVDGTVELKQKSIAFVNLDNRKNNKARNLYIRNVYVKNADPLISSFGKEKIPAEKGDWTHIREYAYACNSGVIRINGKNQGEELIDIEKSGPPPNLMGRHMLSVREIPFGLDKDAVCITDEKIMGIKRAAGDGVTDDTEALRYAISKFSKIFVPKGLFRITGTISLREDTILFGITPGLSVIMPDVDLWENNGPIFTTPDDSKAKCLFSQVGIKPLTKEKTWKGGFPVLDWKAGRNSVVKNIFIDTDFADQTPDAPYILISGNGGGRWYAFDAGSDPFPSEKKYIFREKYLHLLVSGTREPLLIYSHCSIHGVPKYLNLIENSKNIELYGGMDETGPLALTYMKIVNSSNILIAGHGGHLASTVQGEEIIPNYELSDCKNITMAIISSNYSGSKDKSGAKWYRIKDDQGNIPGDKSVSYYRIGSGYKR
jgi:hypothetical protein